MDLLWKFLKQKCIHEPFPAEELLCKTSEKMACNTQPLLPDKWNPFFRLFRYGRSIQLLKPAQVHLLDCTFNISSRMPAYALFNRTHQKITKLIYTLAAFVSCSRVRFTIRFSLTIVSSLNKHLLVIRQFIYECGIINVIGIHSMSQLE